MSITRLPSRLFEQAWEDYQRVCRRDGLVPLNRFCEARDVPVQRLYEWLRRRDISVKEFQARFPGQENGDVPADAGFIPLSVGEQARDEALCVENLRIECAEGKLAVSVGRMPLPAFSHVLAAIKALYRCGG